MNIDFASVATIPVPDDIEALILRPGLHPLSDAQFAEFCAQNPELRIEMKPDAAIQVLDNPIEISGDPLLKGFVLKLEGILD